MHGTQWLDGSDSSSISHPSLGALTLYEPAKKIIRSATRESVLTQGREESRLVHCYGARARGSLLRWMLEHRTFSCPPRPTMSQSHSSAVHGEKDLEVASHDAKPLTDIANVDEKKLVRKIDWHVLPCICVLYLLSFLDRYVYIPQLTLTHKLTG
jgi:hypothetical protein